MIELVNGSAAYMCQICRADYDANRARHMRGQIDADIMNGQQAMEMTT